MTYLQFTNSFVHHVSLHMAVTAKYLKLRYTTYFSQPADI